MMAAMGQQDCGQCGYTCQDYSDAISSRKEERLNLCVPAGKETTGMLEALHQELGTSPSGPAAIPTPAAATVAPATAPGCSHASPAKARFLSRTRLDKPGSEKETLRIEKETWRVKKETWHIEFDLAGTGIDDAAIAFVANLKKSARYQQDVH
jgi:sulfite reductase (NADPH) flavoprotein alpha-component